MDLNVPKVYYNAKAHLKKFSSKLFIYDVLITFKEMRESFIKTLIDRTIYLAQLAITSSNETLFLKEVPSVIFLNEELLLGTIDHNHILYISINVDNFNFF